MDHLFRVQVRNEIIIGIVVILVTLFRSRIEESGQSESESIRAGYIVMPIVAE